MKKMNTFKKAKVQVQKGLNNKTFLINKKR